MIAGQFSDLAQQKSVLPAAVVRALEAIQKVDPQKMEPGRYEVEGDKLFYLVQDVELRTLEESRAEAHRHYAVIQLPYWTSERYGFALPLNSPRTRDITLEVLKAVESGQVEQLRLRYFGRNP